MFREWSYFYVLEDTIMQPMHAAELLIDKKRDYIIYENPEYKEFMKLLAESDKDAFRKNEWFF